MDNCNDDCFLVFVRAATALLGEPEVNEQPLAVCASYAEARLIKLRVPWNCVIRYAGCTGGGD
jgi:hypothetical protein